MEAAAFLAESRCTLRRKQLQRSLSFYECRCLFPPNPHLCCFPMGVLSAAMAALRFLPSFTAGWGSLLSLLTSSVFTMTGFFLFLTSFEGAAVASAAASSRLVVASFRGSSFTVGPARVKLLENERSSVGFERKVPSSNSACSKEEGKRRETSWIHNPPFF